MAIEWTQDLAVGVPGIDRQHQEIFRRVDALLQAAHHGAAKDRVGELVDFLAKYVVEHFSGEERAMAQHAYPGVAAHKERHAAFLKDFSALRAQYERDGASLALTLQVQRRVVDWLVTHIKKEDKAFGVFLAKAGAEKVVA